VVILSSNSQVGKQKSAGSIESLKVEGSLKKKATMDQCVDCHKNKEDKGEKSGPTSCKGCHKK
jgi:cytochrome c2